MIRLVLFDIDGTLINTGGAGTQAFARTFAMAFSLPNGSERMKFAGRTDTSLAREFFGLHQIEPTPQHFHHFFDTYVFWLDHLVTRTGGTTLPGTWEFVRGLRSLPQAPALGLLTGNIRLGAEIKLRHYQLWELFQTGAFADDHEDRNEIAIAARQRGSRLLKRKLRGDEILVIGDTPRDIECGRAIDARVLAVATGGATLENLQSHEPDWLVNDLREASAKEICR